ncbi:MAG: hypothetical protein ABIN91_06275 [Mucilaginibacter sp.]|uniref:hypothetical protein n=1 Tax=Mucilaginibacter sp. TaxID=1882438 RepID=UPI0032669898
MKSIVLRFSVVAAMLCLMFAACKKAEVSATATDPELTFALIPDNPVVTFAATQAGGVALTSIAPSKQAFSWYAGTGNITRFRLNAKRGGLAAEYSSGSLSNINLFSLNSLLSTISIPKGDYTDVRATVIFSQVTAPPYPIVLLGTYTTGSGTNIPVEFDLNDNLEINVNIANIIADGSKDFTANIAMHLNMFLNSVSPSEIDNTTRTTNGSILISKTINTTLYNKIKGNMLACSGATLANKPK